MATEYRINHVHIRSADPHTTAAWYEKHFGARIVSEREVMPNTITIGMQMGGQCRLNVSSQPPCSSDARGAEQHQHPTGVDFGPEVGILIGKDDQFDQRIPAQRKAVV